MQNVLYVVKLCNYYLIIGSFFLTLAHVLPEDGIFLPKHVGVMPLLFICIWHCTLD